jgi:hypothetical protein
LISSLICLKEYDRFSIPASFSAFRISRARGFRDIFSKIISLFYHCFFSKMEEINRETPTDEATGTSAAAAAENA